ncbi:MAG: hypothetical protein IPJ33_15625 [Gammaproteobacteria bacterium]|nr:hypothetical protein [Gammaproteobacteria bacterium]MBK7729870.1 hypothetical protein [Gammaproteobacteria bacterium]
MDALLAGILFDQLQDVEAAHAAIPLRCENGLYYASAAIYEATTRGKQAFVANLRAMHSLDPDLMMKNKAGQLHRRIGLTRQRDFGAVMNSYACIDTLSISWFCEGDADRIRALLESVHFIGKRRASGFGEVARWEVEPGELDGVTGIDGEPLRPVPIDLFTGNPGSIKVDTAWRPAYWHPAHRAICYAPEVA